MILFRFEIIPAWFERGVKQKVPTYLSHHIAVFTYDAGRYFFREFSDKNRNGR